MIASSPIRRSVKRLDQALILWEQYCFVVASLARIHRGWNDPLVPITGPLANYRALRNHLLHTYPDQPFDYTSFVGDDPKHRGLFAAMHSFPHALYAWTAFSRRVYRIVPSIQSLLLEVPLKNVRWKDLLLPFYSFAIELEDPITVMGSPCDLILVADVGGTENRRVEIHFFGESLDTKKVLNRYQIESITSSIQKKRWDVAADKITSLLGYEALAFMEDVSDLFVIQREGLNQEILHTLSIPIPSNSEDIEPVSSAELSTGVKLVVGLCFYLMSRNRESAPTEYEYSDTVSPDPDAIKDERDICSTTYSNVFLLSPHYDQSESRGGYEMPPHWRSAHKKRRRGEGRNPYAEWSVYIPPTFVRPDRLVEGGLPGGSIMLLS